MAISPNLDPAALAVLVAACFTGIGNLLAIILASRKSSKEAAQIVDNQHLAATKIVETQKTVAAKIVETHQLDQQNRDVLRSQLTDIAATTDKIHDLANGNLSALSERLEQANKRIEILSRGIGPNEHILEEIKAQLNDVAVEIKAVRARQHDFADFIHAQGLAFELKPIVKPTTPPSPPPTTAK